MGKSSKLSTGKEVTWNNDLPFNALPPLPPPVIWKLRQSSSSVFPPVPLLAELKQAAERIPNQGMLINTVPLLEAQASTEIENIVTTTDRLFQFQNEDEHADPATKEALRYSRALFEGYKGLTRHPLNSRTAEQVCTIIKGKEMLIRRVPGTALARESGKLYIRLPLVKSCYEPCLPIGSDFSTR